MTNRLYKLERRRRGTAAEVAAKLGVHKASLDKRERGGCPISKEAALALLSLPLREDGKLAPEAKTGRPKKV
jgi:transcriptional regulator with XRE-family HTH domain